MFEFLNQLCPRPEKKRTVVRKTLYIDNKGQVDVLKKENQKLKEEVERLNQRFDEAADDKVFITFNFKYLFNFSIQLFVSNHHSNQLTKRDFFCLLFFFLLLTFLQL